MSHRTAPSGGGPWWSTPAEFDRILDHTPLWDGRVKVLQVTDAVGGLIRIRVLVTAVDAPTLFDCAALSASS